MLKHILPDIDDCIGVTCYNGGVCEDLVNGYKCQCAGGFVGDNCTKRKLPILIKC